jgi:long-chain acyl-CoA synthetase
LEFSSIQTLPELILHQLRQPGTEVNYITYANDQQNFLQRSDFFLKSANLALHLKEAGVQAGENIALVGPSGPTWLMVDLAIQTCGAVSVPMFANLPTQVAKDQIELAKLKKLFWLGEPEFENFETLIPDFEIIWIEKNNPSFEHHKELNPLLSGFSPETCLKDIEEMCSRLDPQNLATIIFTSGSTSMPKGVMLSQHNLCTQVLGAAERFKIKAADDTALSCLPLAHVFERMVTYYYLFAGIEIHWVDDLQTIAERMKTSKPTIMTAVPRLLEKVYNAIHAKINTAPFPIHHLGKAALNLATQNSAMAPLPWYHSIYDRVFYKKFRASFGGKMRLLITGGAALPPHLAHFFNYVGIPTYQGYGLSETSPVICANYPGHNRMGTVGQIFPDIEIKILEENQEILSRGPNTMLGYYAQPELTAEVIDQDGWFHTGDQGEIDSEGYLKITGRIKELCKTSNGKYVRPVPIESELTNHEWIDQAMIVADARSFVTALLSADEKTLPQLKVCSQLSSNKLEDHLMHPKVIQLIQKHIDKLNKKFHPWEQVRKFAWIPEPLTPESGELTPTMKIKRHVVQNKYRSLIESLYND